MNIFFLDKNPKICAQYHTDKHVVKMILESAQILATVIRLHHGKKTEIISPVGAKKIVYLLPGETFWFEKEVFETDEGSVIFYLLKLSSGLPIQTHTKHPCTIWAAAKYNNWEYVWQLMKALDAERNFRYRHNRSHETVSAMLVYKSPENLTLPELAKNYLYYGTEITSPALAMPDEFKTDNAVESYRNYYNFGKQHLHKWTRREIPSWIVT